MALLLLLFFSFRNAGLIEHVTREHHFHDDGKFFRVCTHNLTPPTHLRELVQQILGADSRLVADRKWRLRTFKACAIGHEIVTFLLYLGKATSREEAVELMQQTLFCTLLGSERHC